MRKISYLPQRPVLKVGKVPQSVVAGDFNADGLLDLATVNSKSDDVSVLIGNGNGTFQSAVSLGIGNIPMSLATADMNGDAIPDLVVAVRVGPITYRGVEGSGGWVVRQIGNLSFG